MADEKDPESLDPSKNPDDETTTPDQREDHAVTPDSATDHEVDPETRMLEQIAALEQDNDDAASGDTSQDDDSMDDQPTEVLEEDGQNPDSKTEHTAVLTPVSAGAEADDDARNAQPTARRKKRRWPWVVAVVILLLGGAYVGLAFAT
ncbi:MAG TPA: hypothetical protein VIG82_06600, partial [Enteractinococcus sp.]